MSSNCRALSLVIIFLTACSICQGSKAQSWDCGPGDSLTAKVITKAWSLGDSDVNMCCVAHDIAYARAENQQKITGSVFRKNVIEYIADSAFNKCLDQVLESANWFTRLLKSPGVFIMKKAVAVRTFNCHHGLGNTYC